MDLVSEDVLHFKVPKSRPDRNWVSFRAGPWGNFGVVFSAKGLLVEAYLDTRNRDETKALFDSLIADRGPIEGLMGEALGWERLDDGVASRLALYRRTPNLGSSAQTAEAAAWAAARCVRFIEKLDPVLRDRLALIRAASQ